MNEQEQERVFDGWMSRHRGLLFKVVRAYAFTPQDREDLFQEITTQIWNSIRKFRAESAVTTWLYRIALNTALSWTRKERKHPAQMQTLDGVEQVLLESEKRPDRRLEWLYEQITQLDPIDRSLTLLLLDGFSYREIAETLGITESHVGVKINRIKTRLIHRSKEEDRHEL
jgi:RNA polymerase sigma-70 factor (ECF subfamily)